MILGFFALTEGTGSSNVLWKDFVHQLPRNFLCFSWRPGTVDFVEKSPNFVSLRLVVRALLGLETLS